MIDKQTEEAATSYEFVTLARSVVESHEERKFERECGTV